MIAAEERVRAACEQRAARAERLAEGSESAAAVLRFAAGLWRAQADMAAKVGEFDSIAAAARPLLNYVSSRGPAELAAAARAALDSAPAFAARVAGYRAGGEFDYLARAALSPWAALQREKGALIGSGSGPCPSCGGVPWTASRRSSGGLEGAVRMLHCAACWGAWQIPRIKCPACGEENPEKLPNFGDPAHAGARIEACDSCKGYLKSIDLTDDARRIPEVDDLASIALDLWASEQGYERLEAGLAGI